MLGVVLAELVALYPGVFLRGEVISNAALAYGMPPWRGHRPATAQPLRANPILSDDLYLFTPWDQVTRRAIATGAAPLWNPDAGCGMPLLANNQSAILAPTQSLRWVWDSPLARTLSLLAKPLIAAAGMFLLLRQWRLGSAAAALGAIAYQGSAAMTVWLMYPLSETLAWFPWLLLGVSASLGVGTTSSLWGVPVAAAGGAAVLLAGHLPTAAQLVATAGCGMTALVAVRSDVRARLPRLVGAGLIAAMLAAPQILPTVRYIAGSEAQTRRGGERPAAALHLPPSAA